MTLPARLEKIEAYLKKQSLQSIQWLAYVFTAVFCWNFPPASKDKIARGAFTKGNGTFAPTITPVVSKNKTPMLIPILPSAWAFFGSTYTNINLQKAIKLALELFV